MKILRALVLGLGCSAVLSSCAYFETEGPKADATKPAAEKIDLTQKPAAAPALDVADLIRKKTDGQVEYYSLDAPAPALAAPAAPSPANDSLPPRAAGQEGPVTIEDMPVIQPASAPRSDSGVAMPNNPSVEIFPLDDAMRTALPQNAAAPVYSPLKPFSENKLGDRAATIFFERGQVSLDPGDLETVATVAARLANGGVTVTGFASPESSINDPLRRKLSNLKISMDRALSVARALTESGVAPDRITTVAYGEARPAATSAESRRVEISGL